MNHMRVLGFLIAVVLVLFQKPFETKIDEIFDVNKKKDRQPTMQVCKDKRLFVVID